MGIGHSQKHKETTVPNQHLQFWSFHNEAVFLRINLKILQLLRIREFNPGSLFFTHHRARILHLRGGKKIRIHDKYPESATLHLAMYYSEQVI
jgi:hypothetical protein